MVLVSVLEGILVVGVVVDSGGGDSGGGGVGM